MNAKYITDCHSLSMACGFYMIHFRTADVFDVEIIGHCEDRHRDWPLFEMDEYEFKPRSPTRDMFFTVWDSWNLQMEDTYAAEPGMYHSDDLVYFDYLYFGM